MQNATKNVMGKSVRVKATPEIQRVIDRVEDGCFDALLAELDGSELGIMISAHAEDNRVMPMPIGYMQVETGGEITISEQRPPNAVQVGWFDCKVSPSCDPVCYGEGGSEGHVDGHRPGALQTYAVKELHPNEVAQRVEVMRESGSLPLNKLATEGVGVYMVHAHGGEYEFATLPTGMMAVIEGGRTHFRSRADVQVQGGLVPNVWRFENGIRQPVGGFL